MNIAFVFPGQGSQAVGMLSTLAGLYPQVQETCAEASKTLGYDLWQLICEGPEAELNATEKTQPAMLAAGVAVWRAWRDLGGREPLLLAGHSLGEYTALTCAGTLAFPDAVKIVAERGALMQAAVMPGEGAMAAVLGLELQALLTLCEQCAQGEVVSCANLNAPGQIVVAGQRQAVERLLAAARNFGAKRVIPLPISVPSHCALMKPAAETLKTVLARYRFNKPEIPVIHNCDVSTHDEPALIRRALCEQLYQPVRWIETIELFVARGINIIVECGPGKVLTGLCKRIAPQLNCLSLTEPQGLQQALQMSLAG